MQRLKRDIHKLCYNSSSCKQSSIVKRCKWWKMLDYCLNLIKMTECLTVCLGQCQTGNRGLKSNHLNLRSSNSCKNSSKIWLRGNTERKYMSSKIHNNSWSCKMMNSCTKKRNCSCSYTRKNSYSQNHNCSSNKIANFSIYYYFLQ